MDKNKLMSIIAIHQPNFFPWLGYFLKIQQSNTFVFYDSCQSDSKLKYGRRVIVADNLNRLQWIGLPVKKASSVDGKYPPLYKLIYSNDKLEKEKLLRKIISYYQKEIFFKENIEWLEELITYNEKYLVDYNIYCILKICELLNIKSQFIKSSALNLTCQGNLANVEIVKKLNGFIYISGHGATDYQDENAYTRENIKLYYVKLAKLSLLPNNIDSQVSIIEILFKIGQENLKKILQ
jgi:hypothetical protein